MLTPKKLNGLPAPLTTNTAMMTVVKIGATTTATAVVTITTDATTTTTAKTIAISGVMTARRARGADKAAVAGLITRSTPPILEPSAPTTLTSASCWTAHALSTRMPSTLCESAEA